jgi:antitoxin YefM
MNKEKNIKTEDYEGIEETLAIYSVPGLVKAILEASNSPAEEYISHEEAWEDE